MDKLIVKGLDAADGEYEADLFKMVTPGNTDTLTTREAHRVKVLCGLRGAELLDGLFQYDAALMLALALVVLGRAGKTPNEERMWDASLESSWHWVIDPREETEEGDAAVPPLVAPPLPSDPTGTRSTSGGEVLLQPSEPPASGRNLIGLPASERSATSDPQTLAS